MTADEILKQKAKIELRILKENGFSTCNIERAMAEYAKAKCEEQREICAEQESMHGKYSFSKNNGLQKEKMIWYPSKEDILNAPEPEFD